MVDSYLGMQGSGEKLGGGVQAQLYPMVGCVVVDLCMGDSYGVNGGSVPASREFLILDNHSSYILFFENGTQLAYLHICHILALLCIICLISFSFMTWHASCYYSHCWRALCVPRTLERSVRHGSEESNH